jgi:hypothetical protein
MCYPLLTDCPMLSLLEPQDFINCAESESRPERVHSTVWDSTTRSAVTRAPEDREEGQEVGNDTTHNYHMSALRWEWSDPRHVSYNHSSTTFARWA